jgi:hypothetical protein
LGGTHETGAFPVLDPSGVLDGPVDDEPPSVPGVVSAKQPMAMGNASTMT